MTEQEILDKISRDIRELFEKSLKEKGSMDLGESMNAFAQSAEKILGDFTVKHLGIRNFESSLDKDTGIVNMSFDIPESVYELGLQEGINWEKKSD